MGAAIAPAVVTGSFATAVALAVAAVGEAGRRRSSRRDDRLRTELLAREDELRRETQERDDRRVFRDEQLAALIDCLGELDELSRALVLGKFDVDLKRARVAVTRVKILFPGLAAGRAVDAYEQMRQWRRIIEERVAGRAVPVGAEESVVVGTHGAMRSFEAEAKVFLSLPE